ncbi:MAG: HlyD family secretion protein, partial [Pyrinomonadaceae bacterium]
MDNKVENREETKPLAEADKVEQGPGRTDEKPAAKAEDTKVSATPKSRKGRRRIFLIIIVIGVAAFLIWFFLLRTSAAPENTIEVSGRIESDESEVAAKTSGRIREMTVREGDQVKAGQVIAVLDDDQVKAREEQAQATVDQAEARTARARQQISVLQSLYDQTHLTVDQARLDAQGRVHQAEAQIAQAEAQLAQAEAAYTQARYDVEKFSRLLESGDVNERETRQAQSTAKSQEEVVRAARRQVDVARGALTTSRANLANPAIRAEQSEGVQQQILQAESDIKAAEADAEHARAQLTEARANRSDLKIIAPFDATVATRSAEPGEVITAGTSVVTLVDLSKVYLRAFIPEGQIGRVRVGQRARAYLDS